MVTKTSAFDLALWKKPPHYEHEVITNLEELSLTSSQSAKELNKNFQTISKTLDNASNNIISSILYLTLLFLFFLKSGKLEIFSLKISA